MFKPRKSGSTPVENTLPDNDSRQRRALTNVAAHGLDTGWLQQMVENMPVTVMLVDPKTSEITYLNKTGQDMLRPFRHLLNAPAGPIEGQPVEIFHCDLAHERMVLTDADNLPWSAEIRFGEQTFDLRIAAVRDGQGRYIGPMATLAALPRIAVDAARPLPRVLENLSALAGKSDRLADKVTAETRKTVGLIEDLNRMTLDMGEAINKIQDITTKANLLTLNAATLSRQFRTVAALCAPRKNGQRTDRNADERPNRPARPRLQLSTRPPRRNRAPKASESDV